MAQANSIERQQRLAMLSQLYLEYDMARATGLDDRAREYIAEWFSEAEDVFGENTALVFELLAVLEEAR